MRIIKNVNLILSNASIPTFSHSLIALERFDNKVYKSKRVSFILYLCFLFLFLSISNISSAQGPINFNGATITWDSNSITATSSSSFPFKVHRQNPWEGNYDVGSGSNHSVTGLTSGGTYKIWVNYQEYTSLITLPTGGGGGGGGDTQDPTPPTNLSASNTTSSSTQLSWTASTDNVGVTGYDIYRDGSNIGSTPGTSYTVNGLSASTSYNFYIVAKDAAGNSSSDSNPITVTTSSSGGGGTGSGFWTGTSGTSSNISRTGSVAIGTTNFGSDPTYKFLVKGGIKSEVVKVELCASGGWCDYVFADDYDLQPLTEVEKFILQNQHLPNIPSEAAMEEDGGIDLGNMTVLQQEKIEEIYLHLIEMDKKMKSLTVELEHLKKENQALKKQK